MSSLMDDEERILSCQREIFRLSGVVRCLEEAAQRYERELIEETERESAERLGLRRALELWQEIKEEG